LCRPPELRAIRIRKPVVQVAQSSGRPAIGAALQ
jgi:hypothetical protein